MEKKNLFRNPIIMVLTALLCCLLWGSANPCIKLGYSMFQIDSSDTMTIVLFAGLRFTIAGILTVIFASFAEKKIIYPAKSNISRILVLAIFQTVVQYFFFYNGLAHTKGYISSMISGTAAVFSLLISALIFKMEKITPTKLLGCFVALAGIIVINMQSGFKWSFKFNGEGFLIIATISYAISTVLIKKYSKFESPVVLSGYQFILGGMVMIFMGYMLGGRLNQALLKAYLLLLYLGFLSATAYSLWGILLKYNDVSKVAVFSATTPIFGTLLSVLILQERVNVIQVIVALVLICTGVILVNSKTSKLGNRN